MIKSYIISILVLSLIALSPLADAGCSCSGGTWDPSAFLNLELGNAQPTQTGSTPNSDGAAPESGSQKILNRAASFPNGELLKPMKSVSSSDVVIDVSNTDSYTASHIKDAVWIPTRNFLDDEGKLKSVQELAGILGDAGVSRDDSIVLYAGKESSGEAEFAFLVLKYLGHEDVTLLDGSLTDWKSSGLPVDSLHNKRPGVEYKPDVVSRILADYEYVKSGQARILDVRPFVEFGKGRIPGSSAMDPSNVIKGDKIKYGDDLGIVFSRLDRDTPIVVYSDDYSRSSLVWYTLQLMGYEASIYDWEDWKAHQASSDKEITSPASTKDSDGSRYTKLGRT
ncbi:MAG: putative thiosulfate sulfurtransferase [Methanosaeta sp. PtaU1.Bin112]|nr:MAG: putative thiosulfate sulfurtransferase [Methanosaeta sp. PtaU1.Bin112]